MIDASALHMVLAVLTGWLDRQERQAIAYLMEESRVLRRHWVSGGFSLLRPTGGAWRSAGTSWAGRSYFQIATIVTPDTILRWHRQLIVRKWTYPNKRAGPSWRLHGTSQNYSQNFRSQ